MKKARLTIELTNRTLRRQAHAAARRRHRSLSALVTEFLCDLIRRDQTLGLLPAKTR